MEKIQETIAKLYIAYMCVVFCLYYNNNYIDILQAKRLAFLCGGGIYVTAAFLLGLVMWWKGRKTSKGAMGRKHTRALLFLVVLVASWVVSFGISVDKAEAFWGNGAKCTGLLMYLIGALSVWFLWKYLNWTPALTWLFLIASGIVCLLQIVNRWGADPLGMYSNLVEEEKEIFVSTIGQVNYNAAFDCLVIAALMAMFLLCRELFSKIVYGTVLAAAYAGAICCCSDSVYPAIAVMFAVLLLYVSVHPEKWRDFCIELILLDAAVFAVWLCWNHIGAVRFWGISALLFNMKLHWLLTGAMWLFILAGFLCRAKWSRGWRWYCTALVILAPLAAAGAWCFSFAGWERERVLGTADGRLDIWGRVWRAFENAPLLHKLWGYGFNNVSQALSLTGAGQVGSAALVDAHNIFLNCLLTSGVIGTVLLVVFLLGLLVDSVRAIKKTDAALAGCMIVLAYAVQGMFNGPQVLTEPVYLVGFGVAAGIIRRAEQPDTAPAHLKK
jgi:hypothetical protein